MPGPVVVTEMSPHELNTRLKSAEVVLIDVREPQEYAAGRIYGALNFPLSTFDPRALPSSSDRLVVLHCGSGKRSAAALEQCQRAGLEVRHHLAGGIAAWRNAGLPTTVYDPGSDGLRNAS